MPGGSGGATPSLTAARAQYLDNINNSELLNISAARLGYVDDINNGTYGLSALETLVDDLETRLSAARAGYLDELAAANIPADVDTLLVRLSALRAGYLDELDFDLNARLGTPAGASLAADLVVIDDFVDALESAVGAIEGATTLHNKLTAARAALLDQITALRMAELDAANIPADVDTLLTRLSALRAGYLDELDFDLTARLGTPAGASLAADLLTIDNLVDDLEGRLTAARATDLDFAQKVIEVSVTSAANAGLVTLATVTTQPCQIESIVIHADAAQTADMTTCAVKGGASQVVTFIGTGDATQANLNAADKQVGWTGVVRLAATKTIVIDLLGTGATAVDLTVTITYRACVAGGSLT